MACSDVRFAHGHGDHVRGQHIGTHRDDDRRSSSEAASRQRSSMMGAHSSSAGDHGTRSTPLRLCGSAAMTSSRSAAGSRWAGAS